MASLYEVRPTRNDGIRWDGHGRAPLVIRAKGGVFMRYAPLVVRANGGVVMRYAPLLVRANSGVVSPATCQI